ncbi:MAG: metalloregulator ArsR/SmtB family transcription factor [Gemmatimonadaceae bacterium]
MPYRVAISRRLAEILSVLAHPARLRIVEELGHTELDVASLSRMLSISHSRTSQHLGQLRAHRLVEERREGRQVFYHLRNPGLARWLLEGLDVLESDADATSEMKQQLQRARAAWSLRQHPSP